MVLGSRNFPASPSLATLVTYSLAVTKSRKPKIFHLCYGGLGGHNTVVTNLALEHKKLGAISEAILIAPTGELLSDTSSWPGLDRLWPVSIEKRGDFRSMWNVFQIVRRRRSEIVICHTHRQIMSVWLGQLCGYRFPRIILAEHHAISLRSKSDNLWSFIGVWLSKKIVVSTSTYADQYRWKRLAKFLKRPILVIPNGVSVPTLDGEHRELDKSKVIIGMAARLVESKDVGTILEAMCLLKNNDAATEYLFLIAGDGPLKPSLERQKNRLSLDDQVVFLGMLNQVDLDKFYRSIDIYIHSTQAECFGMVVLEAASYALPIIATRVEGVVNQIPTDCIQLFTLGDPEDLARKILVLENQNFADQMGKKARDHVINTYSSEEVALGYLEMVSSTINQKSLIPDGDKSRS